MKSCLGKKEEVMKSLYTPVFMSDDFVHLLILFQYICFGRFPYFTLLPV